jgi:predicted nucleic acid-binding protein
MEALLPSWEHPTEKNALAIQQTLWDSGLMRAAAAFDCLIAAYAVVNDAVILNSDHDFEYLEIATDGVVRQEYVAA